MIRIGTAEPDSTFLSQGTALAAMLARSGVGTAQVLESPAASIDNANRLHRGEIDFGFMAANWIGRAKRGAAPFAQPIDLRLVAPMNVGPLFFIARADSGLRVVDDLIGKRVAVGPAGSGMTQHAHTILGALHRDISWFEPAYLSFAEGADALAKGTIDAQLQCPIPNKIMTALDDKVDLAVLDFSPEQLAQILEAVGVYAKAPMRKGSLRALGQPSNQPGVLNVLVCHACTDAALVEGVARTIATHATDLASANALFDSLPGLMEPYRRGAGHRALEGVALHDGATATYGRLATG